MLAVLAALVVSAPQVTRVPCEGYALVFTSPSGEVTEDDERLEVEVAGRRFPVPLAPAWFTGAKMRTRSAGLRCREQVPALEVRPGVLVLLLSRSGRPQLDLISLALVDLRRGKALAVLDTRWSLASAPVERDGQRMFSFVHREAAGGFDLRAVRDWLPGDDTLAAAMEDWLSVRVVGDSLQVDWLRPDPPARRP